MSVLNANGPTAQTSTFVISAEEAAELDRTLEQSQVAAREECGDLTPEELAELLDDMDCPDPIRRILLVSGRLMHTSTLLHC